MEIILSKICLLLLIKPILASIYVTSRFSNTLSIIKNMEPAVKGLLRVCFSLELKVFLIFIKFIAGFI